MNTTQFLVSAGKIFIGMMMIGLPLAILAMFIADKMEKSNRWLRRLVVAPIITTLVVLVGFGFLVLSSMGSSYLSYGFLTEKGPPTTFLVGEQNQYGFYSILREDGKKMSIKWNDKCSPPEWTRNGNSFTTAQYLQWCSVRN